MHALPGHNAISQHCLMPSYQNTDEPCYLTMQGAAAHAALEFSAMLQTVRIAQQIVTHICFWTQETYLALHCQPLQ